MRSKLFNHEKLGVKPYNGQLVRFLHEKYDGNRLTVIRQSSKSSVSLIAMTRDRINLWPKLEKIAREENIWQWLIPFTRLPFRTSIDGEIYVPGMPASYVKTAIVSRDPELKFMAFAVPYLGYKFEATRSLKWAMDVCSHYEIPFAPFVDLEHAQKVDVEAALKMCPADREGYVAKVGNYHEWYRIKARKTIDAFVTGITEGKGKYKGMCGSLICSVYGPNGDPIEICACSGMTDKEREQISSKDIDRVVEVEYEIVLSAGRLRHPSFVRWRDDKSKVECTVSQDLELLRYWRNVC